MAQAVIAAKAPPPPAPPPHWQYDARLHDGTVWIFCDRKWGIGPEPSSKWGIGPEGRDQALKNANFACKNWPREKLAARDGEEPGAARVRHGDRQLRHTPCVNGAEPWYDRLMGGPAGTYYKIARVPAPLRGGQLFQGPVRLARAPLEFELPRGATVHACFTTGRDGGLAAEFEADGWEPSDPCGLRWGGRKSDGSVGAMLTRTFPPGARYVSPANTGDDTNMFCVVCSLEAAPPSDASVTVRMLTGESFALAVSTADTVGFVKRRVAELQGIPPHQQRLALEGGNGFSDDDGATLAACGVTAAGAVLHLVVDTDAVDPAAVAAPAKRRRGPGCSVT